MAANSFQAAAGTFDVFPPKREQPKSDKQAEDAAVSDINRWHWIESHARDLCRRFGYEEVRTPTFEVPELFRRAVGEGTDIVSKEMYDVVTEHGSDKFTLRPEGTAPVLRAYVKHRLDIERPVTKLYYLASIFRHEANQRGRYREHHQFGIEVLGARGPDIDAEVISLAYSYLYGLGIRRMTLKINSVGTIASRARYVDALRVYAEPLLGEMSEDNQRRFRENPLRMLDSKHQRDQELMADAPFLYDYLEDESQTHFDTLRGLLDELGLPYQVDPRLVRGFDYYTQTAFEIVSPDVADRGEVAIAGGGRYDKLVEDLGGPAIPGIGFGSGIERVIMALRNAGVEPPAPPAPDAFLIPLGDAARRRCVSLLASLRAAGLSADMDYTQRKKMGQLLEQVDLTRARHAVIIGDDELARSTAQVRDMTRVREINSTVTDIEQKRELARQAQSEVPMDRLADTLRGS